MTDLSLDPWRAEILAQLAEAGLGSVLQLGAGSAETVEGLAQTDAQQIRLVEPDPRLAAEARQAAQDLPAFEIIEAAVSERVGRGMLRRFNLSGTAALRAPSGLATLFPGLREIDQVEVALQDITTLLDGLDLPKEGRHLLVIEAPGESGGVIDGLMAQDRLQAFSDILLPLPPEPLYQGAETGAALREKLERMGFRLQALDSADPDRPVGHMQRDSTLIALQAECDSLRARSQQAEQNIETLQKENAQLTEAMNAAPEEPVHLHRQIQALTGERDRLQKALSDGEAIQAALRSDSEDLTGARDKALSERDDLATQLAGMQKAQKALEKERDELAGARDKAVAKRAALAPQVEALQKTRTALDEELKTVRSDQERTLAKLEEARKQITLLTKARETLESQREELMSAMDPQDALRENLAVALRMQALREADLSELRRRFAESEARRHALEAQFRALGGDLQVALAYLEELEAAETPEKLPAKAPAKPAARRGGRKGSGQ